MKKNFSFFFYLIAIFLLCSCAETQLVAQAVKQVAPVEKKTNGYYKLGKPYRVKGKRYVPREEWEYDEVGYASWYGPKFHNKITANGEIFNQYELSAAHRTLPMPSIVEVTNLKNGRKIKVRVCDRGPFRAVDKRIIDLSTRAAELLGFKDEGIAKVRVKLIKEETQRAVAAIQRGYMPMLAEDSSLSPTERVDKQLHIDQPTKLVAKVMPEEGTNFEPLAEDPDVFQVNRLVPPENPYYIQLGAFSDYGRAQSFGTHFSKYGEVEVKSVPISASDGEEERILYRVTLGPFTEQTTAQTKLMAVQKHHGEAMLIKHD